MTLEDNLKAAEDALAVYRANSKLSKKYDAELEQSLVTSVEHAKAEIQKREEDKKAFWERFSSAEQALVVQQKKDYTDFCSEWTQKARELGYDN